MIQLSEYLNDPCAASSIPYWKSKEYPIPDTVIIIHENIYEEEHYRELQDEPYFG